MDFKRLIKDTVIVKNKFKTSLGKQGRMLDLMEEVGELANAMLMVDGGKTSGNPDKQKTKTDIADALADCLYDLIILADDYDINLDKEYSGMLDRMKARFKSGDLK
jgi:NTP pyrophosphatase (non-canonical NTP hydrolase)